MNVFKRQIQSFGHAFRGMLSAPDEIHFRIHLLAVAVVTTAGFFVGLRPMEWAVVLLCFALVLTTETINTALEALADAVHPEHHPGIGKAKDLAAGAVLIAAIIAIIVACTVFWPYFNQASAQ